MTTLPTLAPGTRVAGRYDLLETLGPDGLGAAFHAADTARGGEVVLRLFPAGALPAADRERLRGEAEAARGLAHANVGAPVDVGTDEALEVDYVAEERLRGETLATLLSVRGTPPRPLALRLLRELAAGTAAAHEAGLVHGDLHPGNVFLSRVEEEKRVRVRVTGFGQRRGRAAPRTGLPTAPRYAAPERLRREALTPAADVFSLGVLAYELLAGLPAQWSPTLAAMARGQEARVTSPLEARPDLPPALAEVVLGALEADALRRFAHAGAFAAALAEAAGPELAPPAPVAAAALPVAEATPVPPEPTPLATPPESRVDAQAGAAAHRPLSTTGAPVAPPAPAPVAPPRKVAAVHIAGRTPVADLGDALYIPPTLASPRPSAPIPAPSTDVARAMAGGSTLTAVLPAAPAADAPLPVATSAAPEMEAAVATEAESATPVEAPVEIAPALEVTEAAAPPLTTESSEQIEPIEQSAEDTIAAARPAEASVVTPPAPTVLPETGTPAPAAPTAHAAVTDAAPSAEVAPRPPVAAAPAAAPAARRPRIATASAGGTSPLVFAAVAVAALVGAGLVWKLALAPGDLALDTSLATQKLAASPAAAAAAPAPPAPAEVAPAPAQAPEAAAQAEAPPAEEPAAPAAARPAAPLPSPTAPTPAPREAAAKTPVAAPQPAAPAPAAQSAAPQAVPQAPPPAPRVEAERPAAAPPPAPAVARAAAPQPSPNRVYRLGDVERRPVLSNQTEVRRALARNAPPPVTNGATVEATVRFVVGEDGRVDLATLSVVDASHDNVAANAARVLARARFAAGQVNGRAVKTELVMPITWQPGQ